MNRRRLEVEAWRDAMLAVAGTLDRTIGGPSSELADADNRRRTMYGVVSRHQLDELLRLFDFPDPNLTSDKRPVTTVPLQQLFVLNSEFMVEQCQGAGRAIGDGWRKRRRRGFERALCGSTAVRRPTGKLHWSDVLGRSTSTVESESDPQPNEALALGAVRPSVVGGE